MLEVSCCNKAKYPSLSLCTLLPPDQIQYTGVPILLRWRRGTRRTQVKRTTASTNQERNIPVIMPRSSHKKKAASKRRTSTNNFVHIDESQFNPGFSYLVVDSFVTAARDYWGAGVSIIDSTFVAPVYCTAALAQYTYRKVCFYNHFIHYRMVFPHKTRKYWCHVTLSPFIYPEKGSISFTIPQENNLIHYDLVMKFGSDPLHYSANRSIDSLTIQA